MISLLATVLLLGLLPLAALADNNLVLHYDFQNGAGDTSGNGYDGTIQADSGAAAVLTETGGKNNGAALELTRGSNGAGGYVELPVAALTAITGDWAMVTYCQDEQGRTAFYLNGQLVESTRCYYADMTEKGDGTIPVGFGDVAGSNNSGGVYFGKNAIFEDPATDGLIGEIRVYDDVLSGDAIAALYDAAMDSLEEMAFQDAVETVRGFDKREITKSIELPAEGGSGVTITWTSGNRDVLTDAGELLSRSEEEDITVPMTAVVALGEKEERIEIQLIVKAHTPAARVEEDLLWADRYLDVIVNDTQTELPTVGGSGCDIAWTVASGHAEIRDNVLYKTEGAAENEPITLTATVSYGEESGSVLVDDLVLKDAYVGQVMSYFTNRDDTRGLKLAYVAKHGLMTGVGNGRFNPDGAVTRAMVWTVLARMAGEDTDGGATWYSKAQIWAMETGVSDGTKPMESITREQLAAMLYRFEGSPKVSGNLSAYPDGNTVSDWAADAMVWATETGLINGINGYLKPQSGATRAQLATMLMRFTA